MAEDKIEVHCMVNIPLWTPVENKAELPEFRACIVLDIQDDRLLLITLEDLFRLKNGHIFEAKVECYFKQGVKFMMSAESVLSTVKYDIGGITSYWDNTGKALQWYVKNS